MSPVVIDIDAGHTILPDHYMRAAQCLERGGLVVFPTETVYGLGFRLDCGQAWERFLAFKKRGKDKPVTQHVASIERIFQAASVCSDHAKRMITTFMPGPITVLLQDQSGQTQGYRCPNHPIAHGILQHCSFAVGASSVNKAGALPFHCGKDIVETFGSLCDQIFIADTTIEGLASTIVDLTHEPFQIIREGSMASEIRRFL